jgi:peroxiredoxin
MTPLLRYLCAGLLLGLCGLRLANGGELGTLVAVPDRPAAPAFTLLDLNGKVQALAAYRGRVVIVNFWATWCEPCRKEMPSLERAWTQARERGLTVLAVNWGDPAEAVEAFLKTTPVSFPVLLSGDGEILAQWSVKGLPTTFVLDPDGRIAYRVTGDLVWDEPPLLARLLALAKP